MSERPSNPPSVRIPQWLLGLAVSALSIGGSAIATVAVTSAEVEGLRADVTAAEARIDRLVAADADRAREQAVLAERLESIQSLLVEVRSDVRQLARQSPQPGRR